MPKILLPRRFKLNERTGFKSKWAIDRTTLLDVAILNGTEGLAELIDETVGNFPEMTLIPARPIQGTSFQTLFRTANPTVGFRNMNEGLEAKKSVYEKRRYDCHFLDARWECDTGVAAGLDDGPEAYIAMEAEAVLTACWQHIARQTYYGSAATGGTPSANDAKGFPGFMQVVDTANMVTDAQGTTASTGSSVWAVRLGQNDVQYLWGGNGGLDLSQVDIRDVRDVNDATKVFEAYVQTLKGHVGLRVGKYWALGRIKNLTADTGKGLTDNLVADLLNKFKANEKPDVLLMTRRSREQLRLSRVTALIPAPPIPTDSHGIPIEITDAILNTETIA